MRPTRSPTSSQLKYYELDEIAAKVAPNASKADGVDDASATSLTSSNALADYVRQCQSAGMRGLAVALDGPGN